jgi:hypothetical protein
MLRVGIMVVLLVVGAVPAAAEHDKTDVVTTLDGSTNVGEIKSVQYATLTLNTDPAGLISIEWRYVTRLTSKFEYRVEVSGGARHYGTLGPPREPGNLSVVSSSGTVEVDLADVVQIVPIAHSFLKRVNGSVNFGLTYTQANNALQYNLNGDATYRSPRSYAELTLQSIFSTQDDAESTNQHSLKAILAQIAKKQWGSFELGQLQSNPAQGYDLRLIVGGGAARFFIATSKKLFILNLGAVYNREIVTDSSDVEESVAAVVGLGYRRFKLGSHSPNVQLGLQTFTNVTDTPRLRVVLTCNVNWKIIGDFKFSVQINNSYDSNPPGVDSKNNDLSLVTSIGYTF